MKKNISSSDRIIRVIAGLFLISMLFWVESGLKFIGIIGFVLVFTAIINFCPLYSLFGISTSKKQA